MFRSREELTGVGLASTIVSKNILCETRFQILTICCFFVLLPFRSAPAGWQEKLGEFKEKTSEKVQEAKDKWNESERKCIDCGKTIHGRERCTECEAKRIAEATKQKASDVKQKWNESERRCLECGKIIHGRDICFECEAKKLSLKSKEAIEKTREKAREMKNTWEENKDVWKSQARNALENSARQIQEVMNDPQKRKEVAVKVIQFKHDIELLAIRSFPTLDPDTGKIVPFDTLMRRMVSDAGIGGSFGDDPVGAAYLMMVDSDYLFNSARLIGGPSGDYLTLNEALIAARYTPGIFDQSMLNRASESYSNMKSAYHNNDNKSFATSSRNFASAIGSLTQEQYITNSGHLVFWANVDYGIVATVTFFQYLYMELAKIFNRAGVEPKTSEWLATGAIILGCLLALLIVRVIFRGRLKRKIRNVCCELEKVRKELESAKNSRPEYAVVNHSDSPPNDTSVDDRLLKLQALRIRGIINDKEYDEQRAKIIAEV